MKARLLLIVFALSCTLSFAQNTSVPDDNFESYLETHDPSGAVVTIGDPSSMGDGVMNDMVPTAKINTVTSLYVNGQGIFDLTGIEDFTALQILDCQLNPISSLTLPSSNNLLELYCNNLDLTSLDVSGNMALTTLVCRFNDLTWMYLQMLI